MERWSQKRFASHVVAFLGCLRLYIFYPSNWCRMLSPLRTILPFIYHIHVYVCICVCVCVCVIRLRMCASKETNTSAYASLLLTHFANFMFFFYFLPFPTRLCFVLFFTFTSCFQTLILRVHSAFCLLSFIFLLTFVVFSAVCPAGTSKLCSCRCFTWRCLRS